MDGAGVLFEDKDPIHVALLMDAIVSSPDIQDQIVEGQLTAVDRLRSKDFAPQARMEILCARVFVLSMQRAESMN